MSTVAGRPKGTLFLPAPVIALLMTTVTLAGCFNDAAVRPEGTGGDQLPGSFPPPHAQGPDAFTYPRLDFAPRCDGLEDPAPGHLCVGGPVPDPIGFIVGEASALRTGLVGEVKSRWNPAISPLPEGPLDFVAGDGPMSAVMSERPKVDVVLAEDLQELPTRLMDQLLTPVDTVRIITNTTDQELPLPAGYIANVDVPDPLSCLGDLVDGTTPEPLGTADPVAPCDIEADRLLPDFAIVAAAGGILDEYETALDALNGTARATKLDGDQIAPNFPDTLGTGNLAHLSYAGVPQPDVLLWLKRISFNGSALGLGESRAAGSITFALSLGDPKIDLTLEVVIPANIDEILIGVRPGQVTVQTGILKGEGDGTGIQLSALVEAGTNGPIAFQAGTSRLPTSMGLRINFEQPERPFARICARDHWFMMSTCYIPPVDAATQATLMDLGNLSLAFQTPDLAASVEMAGVPADIRVTLDTPAAGAKSLLLESGRAGIRAANVNATLDGVELRSEMSGIPNHVELTFGEGNPGQSLLEIDTKDQRIGQLSAEVLMETGDHFWTNMLQLPSSIALSWLLDGPSRNLTVDVGYPTNSVHSFQLAARIEGIGTASAPLTTYANLELPPVNYRLTIMDKSVTGIRTSGSTSATGPITLDAGLGLGLDTEIAPDPLWPSQITRDEPGVSSTTVVVPSTGHVATKWRAELHYPERISVGILDSPDAKSGMPCIVIDSASPLGLLDLRARVLNDERQGTDVPSLSNPLVAVHMTEIPTDLAFTASMEQKEENGMYVTASAGPASAGSGCQPADGGDQVLVRDLFVGVRFDGNWYNEDEGAVSTGFPVWLLVEDIPAFQELSIGKDNWMAASLPDIDGNLTVNTMDLTVYLDIGMLLGGAALPLADAETPDWVQAMLDMGDASGHLLLRVRDLPADLFTVTQRGLLPKDMNNPIQEDDLTFKTLFARDPAIIVETNGGPIGEILLDFQFEIRQSGTVTRSKDGPSIARPFSEAEGDFGRVERRSSLNWQYSFGVRSMSLLIENIEKAEIGLGLNSMVKLDGPKGRTPKLHFGLQVEGGIYLSTDFDAWVHLEPFKSEFGKGRSYRGGTIHVIGDDTPTDPTKRHSSTVLNAGYFTYEVGRYFERFGASDKDLCPGKGCGVKLNLEVEGPKNVEFSRRVALPTSDRFGFEGLDVVGEQATYVMFNPQKFKCRESERVQEVCKGDSLVDPAILWAYAMAVHLSVDASLDVEEKVWIKDAN